MTLPWEANTRLRKKRYTIGVNFKILTREVVEWIQKCYTTPRGRTKELPSQAEVADLASKRFNLEITVGLVQKAVNVTEIGEDL